jgi:hypothetical protein
MRRTILFIAAAFMVAAPFAAHAQYGPGGGGGGGGGARGGGSGHGADDQKKQEQDDAKKKKRDRDWGDNQAPLAALKNAGPCPFVKTLYDAGRYVEFKDNKEASANVGFTGEIQGVSAGCAYKDAQPIQVAIEILFEMGKGPKAEGASKTYRYWVAVTQRNIAVIDKQYFDLPVKFPEGHDRVYVTEDIAQVLIPRAAATTSGSNFEILVGFDVTPQMAEFNRQGKRFRLTAGANLTSDSTNRK